MGVQTVIVVPTMVQEAVLEDITSVLKVDVVFSGSIIQRAAKTLVKGMSASMVTN
jgi:hypothetical protein